MTTLAVALEHRSSARILTYAVPIALALLLVPLVFEQYHTILLTYGLVMAIAALGFNLLLGYTGLLSFGHSAYFGTGAYVVALMVKYLGVRSMELHLVGAIIGSVIVTGLFGVVCVRYTRIFFGILTLALSQVLWSLAFKFFWVTGGTDGLRVPTPTLLGVVTGQDDKTAFLAHAYYYYVLVIFFAAVTVLWVIVNSPFGKALQAIRDNEVRAEFVDLNHDSVFTTTNVGGRTRLKQLFLPATLKECDLVVSLAKLKTHHWAGVTLTMKNLFGLMPGIVYGWPKNILHRAGKLQPNSIPHCIVDIVQTVQPAFGIIDGIVGMEGDGPIMGNARPVGCLIMGDKLASVDATAAAIMGLQPHKVPYLVDADRSGLGGTNPSIVAQRGETIARFRQSFAVPPIEEWSDLAQA